MESHSGSSHEEDLEKKQCNPKALQGYLQRFWIDQIYAVGSHGCIIGYVYV